MSRLFAVTRHWSSGATARRGCSRHAKPPSVRGPRQVIEHLQRQKLVTQSTVEALGVAVLPGTARFNIKGLDVHLAQPATDRHRNELGTIVTTDVPRYAAHRE
jgi:hypothetical protein